MQITLKAARVNAGYTQKQAAELLGVSNGTLLSWETGKTCPTIDRADALCKLYGRKREEIIYLQSNRFERRNLNNTLEDGKFVEANDENC